MAHAHTTQGSAHAGQHLDDPGHHLRRRQEHRGGRAVPAGAARGRAGPMTNDVDVDDRGLIYLVDRGPQFDILEFKRG